MSDSQLPTNAANGGSLHPVVSRRAAIVAGLNGQNEQATFQGMRGFWCQGDCVFIEAVSPQSAIAAYRQMMAEASIAISHNHFTDGILRAKEWEERSGRPTANADISQAGAGDSK